MAKHSFGTMQIAILRTCAHGQAFVCSTDAQYFAAIKLADRGFLSRDLTRGNARRFIGNDAGTKAIIEHDAALSAKLGDDRR